MPLFEYRCNDCDGRFEELTSHETVAATCPHCRSENTTRLLSAFAAPSSSRLGLPSAGPPRCGGRFT
ncbi:MAG TPA: zinc ribbon domain-containing protein [Acidobacteriota bacterium]|nr:zinc ribbon domain-containing protein [Acidobacteriota bacterium]